MCSRWCAAGEGHQALAAGQGDLADDGPKDGQRPHQESICHYAQYVPEQDSRHPELEVSILTVKVHERNSF